MPLPNFTIADPTPQEAHIAAIGDADATIQRQTIQNQGAERVGYLSNKFSGPGGTMSQLQSGLNGSGQWYGGAATNAQSQGLNDFKQSTYDVTSAMQRQLNELDRQRAFTTMGLVV